MTPEDQDVIATLQDDLILNDPLYKQGAASQDAEIADLTKQREELEFSWAGCSQQLKDACADLDAVEQERDELRAQVLAQQARIELYEQALLASWPKGAMGDAFDYWNAARGEITTPDKKRAIL